MKYKKTVCAAGMALLSHSVFAESYLLNELSAWPQIESSQQSGISLYGAVDMGLNYQSVGGTSRWQAQSGGVHTSQFGLFGREDLGGGLKAEFNLENGFMANTGSLGTSNTLFDRAAWVGLNSASWGRLRFGLQPTANLPEFIDPFGEVTTNSVVAWLAGGAVQTPKGIGYNADLGPGSSQILVRESNAVTLDHATRRRFRRDVHVCVQRYAGRVALARRTRVSSRRGRTARCICRAPITASGARRSRPRAARRLFATTSMACPRFTTSAVTCCRPRFAQVAPNLAGNGIARSYLVGATLPWGRNALRASVVYRDTSGVRDAAGDPAKDSALGMMLGYDYSLSEAHFALCSRRIYPELRHLDDHSEQQSFAAANRAPRRPNSGRRR